MNIVKMIAVSAVVAIVLSLMGKQIGSITYNVLHPSDDPVETGYTTSSVPKPKPVAALPVKPVVKKPPE
ncbi:MAG TPA: hypothetical protein DHV36_24750, partial [Desulfobacteraceae bacterium]|nr:hypothetical protein [Desulfobacteraceae bacterium]